MPGPDTVWTVEGNQTLTPSTPVTLTYTNDKGLTFKRTISVDDDYMFKVSDTVTNAGAAPVSLSNYGRVTRFDKPTTASIYVLHEGLIGVTGEEGLHGDQLLGDRGGQAGQAGEVDRRLAGHHRQILGGRAGAAGKQPFQPRFAYFDDGRPRYQADFLSDPITVAPGQSADRRDAGLRRRQGSRQDQRLREGPATSASSTC